MWDARLKAVISQRCIIFTAFSNMLLLLEGIYLLHHLSRLCCDIHSTLHRCLLEALGLAHIYNILNAHGYILLFKHLYDVCFG